MRARESEMTPANGRRRLTSDGKKGTDRTTFNLFSFFSLFGNIGEFGTKGVVCLIGLQFVVFGKK